MFPGFFMFDIMKRKYIYPFLILLVAAILLMVDKCS